MKEQYLVVSSDGEIEEGLHDSWDSVRAVLTEELIRWPEQLLDGWQVFVVSGELDITCTHSVTLSEKKNT